MEDRNVEMWNRHALAHESTTPLDFIFNLNVNKDASILEVGCGYGRIINYLHKHGFNSVQGIDASVVMVDRCHKAGLFDVTVSLVTQLPYHDNTFDIVLCIATLSSVASQTDRIKSLHEMSRVLKPGGILMVRDFSLTINIQRLWRYFRWLPSLKKFGNFMSAEGIEFHHFSTREIYTLIRELEPVLKVHFEG